MFHCCVQLSALVLAKLLSSLPTMRRHLRAGYLLGDTRSDKTGSLAMNNKVCMGHEHERCFLHAMNIWSGVYVRQRLPS
jgi:hypothetical protein